MVAETVEGAEIDQKFTDKTAEGRQAGDGIEPAIKVLPVSGIRLIRPPSWSKVVYAWRDSAPAPMKSSDLKMEWLKTCRMAPARPKKAMA